MQWFKAQLTYLQDTYGADGFKLDGGDPEFYQDVESYGHLTPTEFTELFARIGLDYSLNEVSRNWKNGGEAIVNRLRDKFHTWHDLRLLVPDILLQGYVGYAFTCPDLIGGGDYVSFLPGADEFDAELVVRSAQTQAMMPMMQFSLAPWRVLNKEQLDAVKKAVENGEIPLSRYNSYLKIVNDDYLEKEKWEWE
jgi:alpha-glucosidase